MDPAPPPGPARDRHLAELLVRLANAGNLAAAYGLTILVREGRLGALAALLRCPAAMAMIDHDHED